jgi:DnaJ-class molecular chaperone
MDTFFRLERSDDDPERLLDPAQQSSEPWSGTIFGRCDKCGGEGRTEHECESCRADGPRDDCPACHGKVRYEDECPACEGSGEIDDSSREGVSVFPELDGLYRYMMRRDADLDGCVVVELEGRESADEDFDADEGALLVKPSRIVEVRQLEKDRLERARREVA